MGDREIVIHDCDPGPDDALALMLSLASSKWEVAGITTVSGNASVEQCASNARKIAALCGYGIPVHLGAQTPLQRPAHTLEGIFTSSGLPGADHLADPGGSESLPTALDYLTQKLANTAISQYTICATGPLTNIAQTLERNPEHAQGIRRLVIMGGCVFPEPIRGEMGNFSGHTAKGKAEYNFATDPEAAAIVLQSEVKEIAIVGLNVTRKVLCNGPWLDRFLSLNNPVATTAAHILSQITDSHLEDLGHLRKSPNEPLRAVHDAVTVAYMERPNLFRSKKMHISINVGDAAIAGQSLPATKGDPSASRYPVDVITDVHAEEVLKYMHQSLAKY